MVNSTKQLCLTISLRDTDLQKEKHTNSISSMLKEETNMLPSNSNPIFNSHNGNMKENVTLLVVNVVDQANTNVPSVKWLYGENLTHLPKIVYVNKDIKQKV